MSVEDALYTHLKDDAAIGALVGDRIFPDLARENAARPYIVFNLVGVNLYDALKEFGGLTFEAFDIDVYADSATSRRTVYETVVNSMHGMSGSLGGSVEVQLIRMEDAYNDTVILQDKPAEPIYVRRMNWLITFNPPFIT